MEQLASLLVCCAVEFRHLILGLKRGEQLSKRRQEQLNGANFKLESIVPWSAFHGNIGAGPMKKKNICDYCGRMDGWIVKINFKANILTASC